MPTLNDLAHQQYSANSGTTGSLNDVTVAYLQQVTGLSTNDINDLWDAQLNSLGYTGQTQDMQFEYWGDLGYTGSWNDRYFAWLSDGGAFGPNVVIQPQGTVPTVGFCDYAPAGNCTASRQYLAVDSGFTNPANQWVWSIDPPVAGVVITAGAGTNTVTVETQLLDTDTTFNLKVVATDTISTDTAERTAAQTQYHREDLTVSINEAFSGSCSYDSGIGETDCVSTAIYTTNATGNPASYFWTLSEVVNGTAWIVAGQGLDSVEIGTDGGEPNVQYKLTCEVNTQFQIASDSGTFTQTKTDNPTLAPVFSGPVPDQNWTLNVAITPLDLSTYFTGTDPKTYTIATGSLPAGLTLNSGTGVISGTPTAINTGAISVTATNAAGSDTTNAFNWTVAEAAAAAFYALTPDTADDYRMVGVLTGIGGLTTVHTADLYAIDMNGIYQKYPANAPVWKNGRVVLTGGAGTDVVSVHGNDAPAGTPLAEVPYLHKQGALQNILTYSNTFTNAIWSQQGGISITQDQTGLTGVANGAATFDDQDAGNASYLRQSTIAVTGDIITARVWIKKDATQPGRFPCIEISNNGAEAAYQLKVDTDTGAFHINADNANKFGSVRDAGNWWEVLCQVTSAGATSINQFRIYPAFTTTLSGNVVVSATGSIVVGQAEIYSGEAYQKVAQTSPIFTVAAAVATDRTAYSFDYANHDNVKGAWYAEAQPSFNNADLQAGGLDSHSSIMTFQLNDYWNLMWYDKAAANRIGSRGSAESRVTYVWTRGLDMKHGVAYAAGDNQHQMVVDGTDGTLVTFTQFPSNAPTISLGSTSASATDLATGYREIQRFDATDFADAKSIIDGLMGGP